MVEIVHRPDRQDKVHLVGTHRVRHPGETLAWIEPILPLVGITRLADVTWLDEIGIPVYQAIRPNALLLSVSQGKGMTRELAKVSAAMESIELWHAEHLPRGRLTTTVGDVTGELGYNLTALDMARRHCLNPATQLEWISATRLDTGEATLVPAAYLRLDARVVRRWKPPLFLATSNGLASGNVYDEALLHGLYELIERDAVARARTEGVLCPALALDTVGGSSAWLLECFRRTGTQVTVELIPHPTGVPVYFARIRSDFFAVTFAGLGCHLDPDVALSRALTEAAQSRVTAIAGTRDDAGKFAYRQAGPFRPRRATSATLGRAKADGATSSAMSEVATLAGPDLASDLALLVARLVAVAEHPPLAVDLTRQDIGIPVVRAVVPGFRCPDDF